MSKAKSLRLDDKVKAEDLMYASMFHPDDNKIIRMAVIGAIALHLIVMVVRFPERKTLVPDKPKNVIIVSKYVPPPPKVERKEIVQKKLTKKVPIPDPTPDEPEPIREPEPEIIDTPPLPPDMKFLIGVPEAPPPQGPLLAGVGDVTNPIPIEESKIQPDYPELARVARLEGNVILQAIIHADGTVGDLEVLRVNRPNMGFETAAIEAVRQWRYHPATQKGKPVEVYFTVFIDFKLH